MSKTIYSVLKIIHNFVKIFGLSPYRVTSSACTRSILGVLWGGIVLIVLQTYFLITIVTRPKRIGTFINKAMTFLDGHAGIPVILSGFVCQWLYLSQIKQIIDHIHLFDQFARKTFKIVLENAYLKLKFYLIVIILGTVILTCLSISSTVTIVTRFEKYAQFFPMLTIPKIMSNVILLPFVTLVVCLRERFLWINLDIDKKHQILSDAVAQKAINSTMLNKILIHLESLRMKHSNLYAMCKILNKAYRAQCLTILFKNVISITIAVYYTGLEIQRKEKHFEVVFFAVTEATVSVLQTLALTFICSEITLEAAKTAQQLHKLSVVNRCEGYCGLTKKINLEIIFFSLQTLHKKVEFTAFHLFVINERFLVSAVTTIVMYFVVVIQLSALQK